MGSIEGSKLYVIKKLPVNRQQKRIAEKEYQKINHYVLPTILAYHETEKKTDELKLIAQTEFLKHSHKANSGNIFVMVNKNFFEDNYPTKIQLKERIKPSLSERSSAIAIIAAVAVLIGLILFLR